MLLFFWACDKDPSVSCATECPAGTRKVSFSEAEYTDITNGGRFLYSESQSCEAACEPLQPCVLPNVPEIVATEGGTEYRCSPLEGFSQIPAPSDLDLSFGSRWDPSLAAP
mgnify:CR=1 FL=1